VEQDSTDDHLTVRVALGERSYDTAIVSGAIERFPALLAEWRRGRGYLTTGSALIVTDRHLADSYAWAIQQGLEGADWKCAAVVLEPGEQTKSLAAASVLYDRLVEMQADRQTTVIAVGGGVVGDLAGFAAATYARGIPFVQVPTTLLAQVDSSVGGKVGINHSLGKNLIGAFYQPFGVFIDTTVLRTLPARDYRSGLAEVIKYGMILDAPFFEYLEAHGGELNERDPGVLRHVVARCCRLKADVVEQDEFERTGLRAVLNYGHTFGHAFEALAGYGELLHGEAVAIGMIYASRLAEPSFFAILRPELAGIVH
jgi:3-dehydroquinate synthase